MKYLRWGTFKKWPQLKLKCPCYVTDMEADGLIINLCRALRHNVKFSLC